MQVIRTITELVAAMSSAKCGGQFVTLIGETSQASKYNKFPTDGGEKVRIDDSLNITKKFSVTFNFATDYDKKMSRILGEEYHAHDPNRVHLVHNVIMERTLKNGGTKVYFIYMDGQYSNKGTFVNGEPITDEQKAYFDRYKKKTSASSAPIEYRTLSVENISEIHINKEIYKIEISAQPTKVAI